MVQLSAYDTKRLRSVCTSVSGALRYVKIENPYPNYQTYDEDEAPTRQEYVIRQVEEVAKVRKRLCRTLRLCQTVASEHDDQSHAAKIMRWHRIAVTQPDEAGNAGNFRHDL